MVERPLLTPPDVITVLGAGNMGSGIAQAVSQAGYTVRVRDVSAAMLERGRSLVAKTLDGGVRRGKVTPARREEILARIQFTTDLAEAVRGASLVVEAVFEEETVKRALFDEVAPLVGPQSIVATNTSSLSVTRLASAFPEPGRFAGLHFFYPAAINRLIEVVGGAQTRDETLATLEAFAYRLRKIPVRVKDAAGFAVNRFFVPYLNEATRMAEEGLASYATIEEVGRELFGTTLGPFELLNVTGTTIGFHSEESLAAAFGEAYRPSRLLESQFRAGVPWDWKSTTVDPVAKAAVRERFLGLVFGVATRLVEEGVASPEATDRGAVVGLRWRHGPFALLSRVGLGEGLRLVETYAARWGDRFPVSQELRRRAAAGEATWPLELVRVEREGPVAWVLLDRPEVMNALNGEVLRQLDRTFERLSDDPALRAVVLAGSSPVFASGADIEEMAAKDVAAGREFGFAGQAVCQRIETFRTPVLALVEGYALGGGLELALACDFIVAADNAKLGLPEVTLGIHTGFGGASRLAKRIGRAGAKYLVLTGAVIGASEASRLGLVARVAPADSARDEAAELARVIARNAPLAVSWVKAVVNHAEDAALPVALRLEGESAGHTFGTHDRAEGMRAFLERRKPTFEGR